MMEMCVSPLKIARVKSGLTQSEAAERMNTQQSMVCYWETGKVKPGKRSLEKMADAYGVTVDELLRKDEGGRTLTMENTAILSQVKEVKSTADIEEVAQMLSRGNWIAICATEKEPYCFCMGRISEQ